MAELTANVPGKRQQAILRQTGNDATFACLIDPYRASDAAKSVQPLETTGAVPATAVKVVRADGGTDLIVVRNDPMPDGKPGPATGFAGQTTQALVTVIRLDKAGKQVTRTDLGQAR